MMSEVVIGLQIKGVAGVLRNTKIFLDVVDITIQTHVNSQPGSAASES